MLGSSALDNLLDAAGADGEPDAEALALLERREAARAARDFAEADRLRDELRARRAGRSATAADGPQLVRVTVTRDRLRPQPGPRGAARRAGARCSASGPRTARRAEPWLRDVEVVEARRTRSPRARAPTPTRASCAEVERLSATSTPPSCSRGPTRSSSRSTRSRTRRTSGAICRTAEVRRRDRRGHPRAPLGRGHAGGLQGVGGRGRAPARSRGCATSPTSSPTPRRPAAGATARRPRARDAVPQPDYSGGVRARARGRGQGLRPRVAAACDELVALPLRGRIESLNVERRRGGPAVRDLAEAQGLDSAP